MLDVGVEMFPGFLEIGNGLVKMPAVIPGFHEGEQTDNTQTLSKIIDAARSIYKIDARKISMETLGKYFPNTPMLAAIVKVSQIMTDEELTQAKDLLAQAAEHAVVKI